jgi:hypothetical protein
MRIEVYGLTRVFMCPFQALGFYRQVSAIKVRHFQGLHNVQETLAVFGSSVAIVGHIDVIVGGAVFWIINLDDVGFSDASIREFKTRPGKHVADRCCTSLDDTPDALQETHYQFAPISIGAFDITRRFAARDGRRYR